jgi:MFS transporter, DHA3 family, macrolide efflux protein
MKIPINLKHNPVVMLERFENFSPCIQGGIQTLLVRNTEGTFIGRVSGVIMPIFMGMMGSASG